MLRIVILGWGSLIWDPRVLKIEEDWRTDGPNLPIEFARISSFGEDDERLTLVLFPEGGRVPVLWTYSKINNLENAISDLMKREPYFFSELINEQIRCG